MQNKMEHKCHEFLLCFVSFCFWNPLNLGYWLASYANELPCWLGGKESTCNAGDAGDLGSFLRLGKYPGEGLRNSLQYSWLENPIDRGGWWATVCGVTKSWTWQSTVSFTILLGLLMNCLRWAQDGWLLPFSRWDNWGKDGSHNMPNARQQIFTEVGLEF